MKFVRVLLLICALSLLLAGCGKKKSDGTGVGDTDIECSLGYIFEVPLENLFINVPDEFHYRELGRCQLFMNVPDENMYVAIIYEKSETPKDNDDAFNISFESMRAQVNNSGNDNLNEIDSISKSTDVINGIEVNVYEGMVNAGLSTPHKSYLCGYSFVLPSENRGHDIPYAILGVVKDGDDKESAAIIKKYTIEMMKSVRDTKENDK